MKFEEFGIGVVQAVKEQPKEVLFGTVAAVLATYLMRWAIGFAEKLSFRRKAEQRSKEAARRRIEVGGVYACVCVCMCVYACVCVCCSLDPSQPLFHPLCFILILAVSCTHTHTYTQFLKLARAGTNPDAIEAVRGDDPEKLRAALQSGDRSAYEIVCASLVLCLQSSEDGDNSGKALNASTINPENRTNIVLCLPSSLLMMWLSFCLFFFFFFFFFFY